MDLSSTVMGLVGLVLCILPFVLLQRSRKKKENELKEGLEAIATQARSEVGAKDLGFEFAVGLSPNKDHLFYYKKTNEKVQEESIPIATVENCTMHTVNRFMNTKKGKESIIDKLELVFILKNGVKSQLEFFNGEEKSQLNGELSLVKKWESMVHQLISKNN
ncbi:hypothetical protein KZP23_13480 [Echinicola marina]|uniref:hypothetical protein n=1 Tax=Echinicola marina TaxID=2859768 RepID=UPI001CF65955|nr:hypothetical protein [Echinicola marina]UCS91752.1 hypothetical protein KZP23_13480 [Echinicola marina]